MIIIDPSFVKRSYVSSLNLYMKGERWGPMLFLSESFSIRPMWSIFLEKFLSSSFFLRRVS